jgi:Tat-targeted selenate reductase subunit YnfH
VAALVISAAVIIMQSAGLSTIHSSVQQAASLLPITADCRPYA